MVIAAITSCTNTSNPDVMLAAGLVAKKAVERGLSVKPYVKTSLAPGSRVVTDYYRKTGLDTALDKLGFTLVGYGCTTCIGNSGPLPEPVAEAVDQGNLVAAAVLSGNRNFEGRINKDVKANYLASPPLVVAYALAGTVDIDLATEPLGTGSDGKPVYLKDLWPSREEVGRVVADAIGAEMFRARYKNVFEANPTWNALPVTPSELFPWDADSTYVQEPPFLIDLAAEPSPIQPLRGARVLAALGDSVTTDHISPAGSIAASSPAGKYLQEHGVKPVDFNSYGARRGNDRVMTRGTFANIRIRNLLAPGTEGGVTRHLPDGQVMPIYDAAMKYKAEGVPLVVLAGAEYGTGSSRDWAAKGTYLLGVRAVLAVSFERIHRSNLVGMGILPLEFPKGKTWESLGLTGEEVFEIPDLNDQLRAAVADHRPRHGRRWQREGVPGQGPHRHARRDGLLSQRRHFADGAEEAGERQLNRPIRHFLPDHLQIALIEADGLVGAEIENHAAIGHPVGFVKTKNRSAGLKITHQVGRRGGQVTDAFQGHGHGHERGKLPRGAMPHIRNGVVKFAVRPARSINLAVRRCQRNKLHLKPFPLLVKFLAGLRKASLPCGRLTRAPQEQDNHSNHRARNRNPQPRLGHDLPPLRSNDPSDRTLYSTLKSCGNASTRHTSHGIWNNPVYCLFGSIRSRRRSSRGIYSLAFKASRPS